MKNKIFALSFAMLALAFVVSGCSLSGVAQNTPSVPLTSDNNPANNILAGNSSAVPTPDAASASTVNSTTAAVSIQNLSFDPAVLMIKKGTEVTWTNNDSVPHKIESGSFSSKTMGEGLSFSFTFNDAGSFDYSCALHPAMTGRIIVE